QRLKEVKETRDQAAVDRALAELVRVAKLPDENIMPATIAAVEASASMGEIVKALEHVFGRYTERPVF
ncbi:MAG TPA: methylmalonyl-CoA mutase family protein, partial [Trebonia sp.]|nr:methylmalonyl-CoA mutase family protein [Trebonia sp.]